VTGFGLAGHLLEMTRASSLGARIHAAKLPILPGAQALLDQGLRSTYHSQNEHARASMTGEPPPILFDPQTAGGMLFGVRPDLADEALAALHDAGERDAAIIGVVTEGVGVEVR
jgi:selenide,water dikinase